MAAKAATRRMRNMSIEQRAKINHLSIVVSNDKEYTQELKSAFSDDVNRAQMTILKSEHINSDANISFDSKTNLIYFRTVLQSKMSKPKENFDIPSTNINMSFELTDPVLIDILQHTITKFNKFKTVLETLKR